MTPTPRQCQIARLLATEGLSRDEVAERLGVTRATVDSQMGRTGTAGLVERIGGRSSLDVVRWYWAEGGAAVCQRVLEGDNMSSPPAEQRPTPDADWTPRERAIYEPAMSLPGGSEAWTRHTDTWDRYLTRTRTDERARPVQVRQSLLPGDRVRIVPGAKPETWEAVKE